MKNENFCQRDHRKINSSVLVRCYPAWKLVCAFVDELKKGKNFLPKKLPNGKSATKFTILRRITSRRDCYEFWYVAWPRGGSRMTVPYLVWVDRRVFDRQIPEYRPGLYCKNWPCNDHKNDISKFTLWRSRTFFVSFTKTFVTFANIYLCWSVVTKWFGEAIARENHKHLWWIPQNALLLLQICVCDVTCSWYRRS